MRKVHVTEKKDSKIGIFLKHNQWKTQHLEARAREEGRKLKCCTNTLT